MRWSSRGACACSRAANVLAEMEYEPLYEFPEQGGERDADPIVPSLFPEWGPLARDWLEVEPPPREWILKRNDLPVLEKGIVGLLVAPGGRGKTMTMVDLAISVATGRPWLGAYDVCAPGNVVLALAEESMAEVRRRLYFIARARGLDSHERNLVTERVVAMGLRGRDVSIIDINGAHVTGSAAHMEILKRLAEREHSLVLMDPLARWAPNVEGDTAIATRAIELLEQLAATSRGSVLMAHHTAKWSRRDGGGGELASSARGVTALVDGPRLVLELTGASEDDLMIAITKRNGVPAHDPVKLVRDLETGAIRAATPGEVQTQTEDRDAAEDARVEDLAKHLVNAVARAGEVRGQRALVEMMTGRKQLRERAIGKAIAMKWITGGGREPYRVALNVMED